MDSEISFTLNTDCCECEHSLFIDAHHKHVIAGDLRIVGNSKLWKLLTKCPKYREPRSTRLTNFKKVFAEITTGLDK